MADVELRKLERQLKENPYDEAILARLIALYKRTRIKGIVFAIEETPTDYVLYNVEHVSIVNNEPVRDVRVNITLSKKLLDNGELHAQEDWIKIAEKEGYTLPDSMTIYSILIANLLDL